MEKFRPQLNKLRYDPSKFSTYLEQLGIKYPTVRQPLQNRARQQAAP
jgi:aminobenzoyl-glutamate utilization protein B